MKKKRLLSCVLIVALLLSLCAIGVGAATVDDFTDVSPDDWYYDAVSEVAAAGYFNGTSATTFDPQLTMTRAMFVTVLARFDGATVDNSADTTFADVPTGQYYTGAVAWAAENGLVQGYGGNAFGTSNPITRQDMAVLMTRYIAYYEAKNSIAATTSAKGSETTHDVVDDPAEFADAASIAAYATEAVVECANYGLLIGDDNGNFRPTASATRAEAATVISRLSWTVEEIDRLSSGGGGGGGGGGPTTYYLKLDPNGGALDASVTVYETNDGVATIRKSSKTFTLSDYPAILSGYTLAGWNTSADGTGTAYATTDTYTSSATSKTSNKLETLYAQWKEATDETYTLTYSFEDAVLTIGEGDTAETWYDTYPVEVTAGTVTVISEAPEKDGYTFKVWKDEAGTEYNPGGTITVDADITLTADFDADVINTGDKIGEGVVTAMESFETALKSGIETFSNTAIAASASGTTYGDVGSVIPSDGADSYVDIYTDSSWYIGKLDEDATRTVTLNLTVETGDADSLTEIAAFAIEVARYIVVDGSLSNDMLNDVIAAVVDGVEDATGFNVSIDKSILTNSIRNALHMQGGSFWVASSIGEYIDAAAVTIDQGISVLGDVVLNLTVAEDGTISLDTENGTLTEQLTNCATALAVQMFLDLQDNLNGKTTDTVTVSPTFTVEFTLKPEYEDELGVFATKYEVVSNVEFNSNNTVLFSGDGFDFSIALNMANEDLIKKYESGFERLLNSKRLSNLLSSYDGDVDTVKATLNQLAKVDKMQEVPVSDLVEILNSGLFDAYNGTVGTMVGRLSTAIDSLKGLIPASVEGMIVVNSIEINGTDVKDTLADIDTVSEFAELLNKVDINDLTVGDLEVVVNLTVTSESYSVTSNITLCVNYD
ncbi:MAG: S-layer homology domain-containing protein [Oscillospiraceae bacterium]|nr:S-layer homology domain-containing protein [Oscillospiraceae bacterium]